MQIVQCNSILKIRVIFFNLNFRALKMTLVTISINRFMSYIRNELRYFSHLTEAIKVLKLLVTLQIFDHMSKMSNIRVFNNKSRELIEQN